MIHRFLSELQRRKVLRVASAYVVGAWIVLQIALALQTAISLSSQFSAAVLALLVIGFPVVVALTWFFEITPDGVKRTLPATGDGTLVKPQTTDLILAAALTLVVIVAVAQWFIPQMTTPAAPTTTTAQTAPAKPEPPMLGDKSIAVLPFTNLSPDKENEYFADGLTEELLNLLAKIGDLKVISRTSSFAFKGKSTSLPEIAKQLGVRHILEGTVREEGGDLRLTAQLIDVVTDTHLWSETYERKIENVFALQRDMARDIAGALNVEITLTGGAASAPTKSLEAYRLYLEGRNIHRGRDDADFPRARRLFEQAIKLDESFAEAHAALAKAYASGKGPPTVESVTSARMSAEAAIKLKPSLGSPHGVFGQLDRIEGNWEAAITNLERAIALDPADSDVRLWLGGSQITMGYIDAAVGTLEDVRRNDPLFVLPSVWLMWAQSAKGNDAAAASLAEELLPLPLFADVGHYELAIAAYDRGDASRAEYHYRQYLPPAERERPFVDAVVRALHSAKARPAAVKAIAVEAALARSVATSRTYALLRAYDPLIAMANDFIAKKRVGVVWTLLWAPRHKALWSDPRFKEVLVKGGLVAYWKKHGWPDRCRAKGEDDFECS